VLQAPESKSDKQVTEFASDGEQSERSNGVSDSMSEPESQVDEVIDELASSGGEGCDQSGCRAEQVQLHLDGGFSPGPSEPSDEAKHALLELAFSEMKAVASQASSEMAAIVRETAHKTFLSESHIVQRWNAMGFTRLVEQDSLSPAQTVQAVVELSGASLPFCHIESHHY
jgi:hypothetical protein